MAVHPAGMASPLAVPVELGTAVILHPAGVLRPLQLPGVALPQPVVRLLHLAGLLDVLAEHAVLVADAIAHHRQLQGGTAVEEAGRQAAKAAITETGVVLHIHQFLQGQAQALEGAVGGIVQAQIEQGVVERPPHQELHGQVVGMLGVLRLVGVAGPLPAFHQAVAQDQGQGLIGIVGGVAVAVTPQEMTVVAAHVQGEGIAVHAQGRQFVEVGGGLAEAKGLEMAEVGLGIHEADPRHGIGNGMGELSQEIPTGRSGYGCGWKK